MGNRTSFNFACRVSSSISDPVAFCTLSSTVLSIFFHASELALQQVRCSASSDVSLHLGQVVFLYRSGWYRCLLSNMGNSRLKHLILKTHFPFSLRLIPSLLLCFLIILL